MEAYNFYEACIKSGEFSKFDNFLFKILQTEILSRYESLYLDIETVRPQPIGVDILSGILALGVFITVTGTLIYIQKNVANNPIEIEIIVNNLSQLNLNYVVNELKSRGYKFPFIWLTPIIIKIKIQSNPARNLGTYTLPLELNKLHKTIIASRNFLKEANEEAENAYDLAEYYQDNLPAGQNKVRLISQCEQDIAQWDMERSEEICILRKLESLYIFYKPFYRRYPTMPWEFL